MSVELERRVRRANMVTQDSHLEQLFDRDLTARLLLDVRAKKEGRMPDTIGSNPPTEDSPISERTVRGPRPPAGGGRKPSLVWVMATIGIVVAGVIWAISAGQSQPVATPAETAVETAVEFMDALNAHDVEAMEALYAPGGLPGHRSEIEQEGVIGWTYHFTCQVTSEAPITTFVSCPYSFTNHITDVFGLEPYEGSSVNLQIRDGVVVWYDNIEFSDEWQGDGGGLERFHDWMVENHPEDAESFYYNYTDEANLDFWKEYIPLLLDSEEASS